MKGRVCYSKNDTEGLKDSMGIYVTKYGLFIYLAFFETRSQPVFWSYEAKLALSSWPFPCSPLLSEMLRESPCLACLTLAKTGQCLSLICKWKVIKPMLRAVPSILGRRVELVQCTQLPAGAQYYIPILGCLLPHPWGWFSMCWGQRTCSQQWKIPGKLQPKGPKA